VLDRLARKEITCGLVTITDDAVTVRVEVIDAGSPDKTPTSCQVDVCDDFGRGLSQVVSNYADSWGHLQRAPHDSVTWFEVKDRTGRLADDAVLAADATVFRHFVEAGDRQFVCRASSAPGPRPFRLEFCVARGWWAWCRSRSSC
jgi:hypothetical protein